MVVYHCLPRFSNNIEDTSFDSVAPVTTQIMDDQNVTLEIVEPSVHSLDMDTEVSVVCGGTKEGWTPVAAVVLWTRVLGVLGNINDIESASIHAQVLYALSEIWHLLAKVSELGCLRFLTVSLPYNQGWIQHDLVAGCSASSGAELCRSCAPPTHQLA
jgi:hypothetical protein